MLRLVHPTPVGQGADPPSRRKGCKSPSLSLTPEEGRRVRAALKNTAAAYGGLDVLAAVLGVSHGSLRAMASNARRPLSGTLAIRLAKVAGVSVEAILTGALTAAGRCPTCGHRVGGAR